MKKKHKIRYWKDVNALTSSLLEEATRNNSVLEMQNKLLESDVAVLKNDVRCAELAVSRWAEFYDCLEAKFLAASAPLNDHGFHVDEAPAREPIDAA